MWNRERCALGGYSEQSDSYLKDYFQLLHVFRYKHINVISITAIRSNVPYKQRGILNIIDRTFTSLLNLTEIRSRPLYRKITRSLRYYIIRNSELIYSLKRYCNRQRAGPFGILTIITATSKKLLVSRSMRHFSPKVKIR